MLPSRSLSTLIQKKNRDLGEPEAAVIRFFGKISLAFVAPRRKPKCDLALWTPATSVRTSGDATYSCRRASIGSISAALRAG
jgi:hypothetical protein